MTSRPFICVVVLAGLALGLAACGTYELQGRVIQGESPGVEVVSRDDPRLTAEGVGVANASVRLTIDPESLGRTIVQPRNTQPDGTFRVPVDEFGAGTLEYDASLLVRKDGHEAAYGDFPLPRSSRRVLVVLPRGVDRFSEPTDPAEDLERFGP